MTQPGESRLNAMLSAGDAAGRAFNLKVRDTLSWSLQVEPVENVA